MYVKIYGTFDSTRNTLFERYGSEWAFQYSETERKDWENKRPDHIVEILLEKINE
jgi:hypothetical protein